MSILNVNKINPVGGGSTVTIAGIASVTSNLSAIDITSTNISVGSSVTTNEFYGDQIKLGDNKKILLGAGNDIEIYHTGAVDMIEGKSLYLIQEAQNIILRNLAGDEAYAKFFGNGAVELYHNGTKQVETSTDGIKFPSGKGINFASGGSSDGPSVSSELLDDYEEGSWTATLNGHSSPTNVATNNPTTSRTATGHYRKIGSYVHVQATWANLQQSGANDMANHQIQTITGLPFTSMGTLFTSELGYSRGIYGRYNNAVIEEAIFYFSLSGSSTTVYPNASQIVQNGPGTLYHVVSNSSSSMYYSFQMSYYTT